MPTEYITIQDSADLCNKSIQTIRRAIKSKKIKIKKQKTPQGFNYLVEKESLYSVYGLKMETSEKKEVKAEKEKPAKKVEVAETIKTEESNIGVVTTEDFRAFARNMERIVSQHSEERQNFLRLVNTLQEKVFVLENQLNLLKAPAKKWYAIWK